MANSQAQLSGAPMEMPSLSEANSQAQTINNFNFYWSHQTISLITMPALAAGNNFASASFINNPIHMIYAFIIPVFIGLFQILTQGITTSLFKIHPVTATISVLCILGYYLAFLGSFRFSSYSTQLSIVMGVCGSLSMVSLVTLLIPDSLWYIRCIFYLLLAVVELHPLFKVCYDKYFRRFILWPSQMALLPLSNMDSR